jgi:hypothetical protein
MAADVSDRLRSVSDLGGYWRGGVNCHERQ